MKRISYILKAYIDTAIVEAGLTLPTRGYSLDKPELLAHGHYATNVALILSKDAGISPKECAQKLLESLIFAISV